MKSYQTQILIIGSGAAGLRCAVGLAESGFVVLLVSKGPFGHSHSMMAEGGVNAAFGQVDSTDSPTIHLQDTLSAGRFINNLDCAKRLCHEAPDRIQDLIRYGANIPTDSVGHPLQVRGPGGGQTKERVVASGDFIGSTMIRALLTQLNRLNIRSLAYHFLLSLKQSDSGEIKGAYFYDLLDGTIAVIESQVVILATGGGSRIFRYSSAGSETTGEGYVVAYEASAPLKDMEMIQFHPTGLDTVGLSSGLLISEAARGIGGFLVDESGRRFLQDYDTRMELSPRDVVSYAIFDHKRRTGSDIYLDLRHVDASIIEERLPNAIRLLYAKSGIDIRKDLIPVAPTAHFFMGGIGVQDSSYRVLPGLYAIGESAWGAHGANRLGGNALAETQVSAVAAVRSITEENEKLHAGTTTKGEGSGVQEIVHLINNSISNNSGQTSLMSIKESIATNLTVNVGIERSEVGLRHSLAFFEDVQDRVREWRIPDGNPHSIRLFLETYYSVKLAILITEAAILRKESRGAHRRSDYLGENEDYRANTALTKGLPAKLLQVEWKRNETYD